MNKKLTTSEWDLEMPSWLIPLCLILILGIVANVHCSIIIISDGSAEPGQYLEVYRDSEINFSEVEDA